MLNEIILKRSLLHRLIQLKIIAKRDSASETQIIPHELEQSVTDWTKYYIVSNPHSSVCNSYRDYYYKDELFNNNMPYYESFEVIAQSKD